MFFVNANHPFYIESTDEHNLDSSDEIPNRFDTKEETIQYRFEKMLKNYGIIKQKHYQKVFGFGYLKYSSNILFLKRKQNGNKSKNI